MAKAYPIVASNHIKGADDFIKTLAPGLTATLVREPKNEYDANAVAVWIEGRKVGYIPKRNNAVLAQFIDQQGAAWTGPSIPGAQMALDEHETGDAKAIDAKFIRSPNSSFPMVEV